MVHVIVRSVCECAVVAAWLDGMSPGTGLSVKKSMLHNGNVLVSNLVRQAQLDYPGKDLLVQTKSIKLRQRRKRNIIRDVSSVLGRLVGQSKGGRRMMERREVIVV